MVRIFVGVAGAAHKKPNDFIIMTGTPSALSPYVYEIAPAGSNGRPSRLPAPPLPGPHGATAPPQP